MTKNKHIDTYSTVFGVDIVIANKNVELKDLQKSYSYRSDEELDEGVCTSLASTSCCKNKKTGRYCILVKFNNFSHVVGINKHLDLINSASHEAFHVLMRLYDFAEEEIYPGDKNETSAYYMGWLTEIIYNTWTKK